MSQPVEVAGIRIERRELLQVRWQVRADLPEVLAIENESFEFPWSEDDFRTCLRERNVMARVAEHLDRVIGFITFALVDRHIEILNLAVTPQARRQGVGFELVKTAIQSAHWRQRFLIADVRESNLAAQLFFRAIGFQAVKILPRYYEETGEDAYRLRYDFKR